MDYREYIPAAALQPFVRCFWTMRGNTGGPERVVPDGFPEIVLNAADPVRRIVGAQSHAQADTLLVGQLRTAIVIEPTGQIDLLGVRFEPAGLHAMVGVPMHELADVDVCLSDLDRRLRHEFTTALGASTIGERIETLSRTILARVERGALSGGGDHGWIVDDAVRHLREQPRLSVGQLARRMRLHPRTLERAFRNLVGITPKLYSRILRMAPVLQLLDHPGPAAGWATIAIEHGYFDQPHLIRDFRALTGMTPQAYVRARPRFSECFHGSTVSRSSNPAG